MLKKYENRVPCEEQDKKLLCHHRKNSFIFRLASHQYNH